MTLDLFGFTIHDPDVALTDIGLAILGVTLAWRIGRMTNRGRLDASAIVLMLGLAAAALWGGIYHGLMPGGTSTVVGSVAWTLVSLSIVVATAALASLALHGLMPGLQRRPRRWIIGLYAIGFATAILAVSDSFAMIVGFYFPVLLLALVGSVRQAASGRDSGWGLLACGFAVSILAAAGQRIEIAIHPVYFDHNAVYHVVQGSALVLLYLGFRRRPDPIGWNR